MSFSIKELKTTFHWHPAFEVVNDKNSYEKLRFYEAPYGCGSMLMAGTSSVSWSDELVEFFNKVVVKKLNETGAGSILTATGTSYKNIILGIEKLGFKPLSTYLNLRHRFLKESQVLHQLIIK